MSEQLPIRTVGPSEDRHLEDAWRVKECIRREDGVLAQGRGFFVTQYRRSTDYLVLAPDSDRVAAFAIVRPDGYLSLLGVAPEHRRQGHGSRLIDRADDDHDRVTCHTRVTNESAVAFYLSQGFVVENRIESYYRDGTDAYELVLGGAGSRFDRLADLLR